MRKAENAVATKPELERAEPHILRKRIGSTVYEVSVYFSKNSKETIGDKIQSLIEREAVMPYE